MGARATAVRRGLVVAAAAAAVLAMEVSGWLATAAAERPEATWTTLHAVVPLVFIACAAVAWRIGPEPLPARIMIAVAVLWIPQTFYRVIEDAGWLWPLVRGVDLVWAVLTGILVMVYPRGRLENRTDRVIAAVAAVATLVNFAAVLLLAGSADAACDCAANPYRVADAPALFAAIDVGYRIIGVGLAMLVAGRQLARWIRGTVPARTVAFLMPLALLAWVTTLAAQAVSYATAAAVDEVLGAVSLIAIASIPVSYVAGVTHVRNLRARVADLMRITREGADRGVWAESLSRALRDASVRVYWWDESRGRYEDAEGRPLADDPDDPDNRQSLLPVDSPGGAPIAMIRHDRVLTDNARLLEGVSSALRLSVDNGRLRSEIERTLEQVRESRQRIAEAALESRRRFERDLHDGAQQQLVSLGLHLRLVANRAGESGDAALAGAVETAIDELGTALRELRELAHGIHPSLLSQGGLALALPELAGRCPVPVEVDVEAEGRLPELVESSAYFIAAEALANVAKHSGASRAWLRARREGGAFVLELRDNGVGGADASSGGIVGMRDRAEAAGGGLELESPPGAGTTVRVRVPLEPPA